MSLLCPKCHNEMHQYERNGVVVDQCTECKGLFLDRGELEKLVKAENGWYGDDDDRERRKPEPRYEALYESRPRYDESPRYEPRPDPRYDPRYDERRRYDDDSYRHSKKHKPRHEPRADPRYDPRYDEGRRYDDDSYRHSKKHKRRSFLEELFD